MEQRGKSSFNEIFNHPLPEGQGILTNITIKSVVSLNANAAKVPVCSEVVDTTKAVAEAKFESIDTQPVEPSFNKNYFANTGSRRRRCRLVRRAKVPPGLLPNLTLKHLILL